MLKFVGIRILQAIPVLIGITIMSFLLIHLVPGDPARLELGPQAHHSQVLALRHQLGLDRSLPDQYWKFLGETIDLRFGKSLALHQPVGHIIGAKLAITARLMLYSLVLSLLLTIPFGILAAVKRTTRVDHAIRAVGMVFFVMPTFWLGLLLSLIFGLELGLVPTSGYAEGLLGSLRTLTLPAVALSLAMAPLFIRSLRASVIEALDMGYVEAARARGFSERRVLFNHVLRNASISTVTLIGLTIGGLLSGALIVENVFSIPGLGPQLVSAVSARDYTMVQGLVVVLAVGVVAINLITDLAYAAIDPRVRL